jgi:hypothetical protein
MSPVFGALTGALDMKRNLNGDEGASFMDKDLRTLLGRDVEGPFNLRYCGKGDLATCRESLWAVIESVSRELSSEYGGTPETWLKAGSRTEYLPGLLRETHRTTNRSTFQQVLEFTPAPAP